MEELKRLAVDFTVPEYIEKSIDKMMEDYEAGEFVDQWQYELETDLKGAEMCGDLTHDQMTLLLRHYCRHCYKKD